MKLGSVRKDHKKAHKSYSSKLEFLDHLSLTLTAELDPSASLLIFDRRLPKVSREFAAWAKRFPHRYAVESGEKLKDLHAFPGHVEKLLKRTEGLSPRTMTCIAAGGGTVGDFAGFFASVFKRGVRLIQIPTTWLAAIDSSHGGKTALNVGGAKNQIGTFYPAERVIMVRSILLAQPEERAREAMGELGKIALLDGGAWVKRLERARASDGELVWEFLKPAVEAKWKVVSKDPRETTGFRQILNLGHTVGHVFEAALGLPHGTAVARGLFFALEFSVRRGDLAPAVRDRAMKLLSERMGLRPEPPKRKLGESRFRSLLLQDKKRSGKGSVTFIFLRGIGRPERVSVSVDELVREAHRQGLLLDSLKVKQEGK